MRPPLNLASLNQLVALICVSVAPSVLLDAHSALAQESLGGAPIVDTEATVRTGPAKVVLGKLLPPVIGEAANGQIKRYEHITVEFPSDEGGSIVTFTNGGGTVTSAILTKDVYTRDELPAINGVPAAKLQEGPIDLVSTWSPRFLPFRVAFRALDHAQPMTRTLRKGHVGKIEKGTLLAPTATERAAIAVDRPLSVGDVLVITAPAALKGEYKVNDVGFGGAITPEQAFAIQDATDVRYEVRRVGTVKSMFEQDPTFVRVSDAPGLPLSYVWPDPATDGSPIFIEKRFDAGAHPYELELTVIIHNLSDKPAQLHSGLRINGWQHPSIGKSNMFARPTNILATSCFTSDGLERKQFPALQEMASDALQNTGRAVASAAYPFPTAWISVDTTYFMLAAAPMRSTMAGQCQLGMTVFDPNTPGAWTASATYSTSAAGRLQPHPKGCRPDWYGLGDRMSCDVAYKALGLEPGADRKAVEGAWGALRAGANAAASSEAYLALSNRSASVARYKLYLGPKDVAFLQATSEYLTESLDLGMFDFIAKPLHSLLVMLHGLTGSWALGIILMTLLIKLLLLPLTNKSYSSMQKMQKLKPKLEALKREHGADKQEFARQQMALFKREGVNPLTGCFPMLLQMPVWFGLYQTIYASVELYHAPMGLWITDMSAPDPFYIMPILLGVLMLVQTLLTTSTATMDGMQGKMLKFGMPIMFSAFMLFLPSGLVLYILVNVSLTIVQNLIIRRRLT